MRKFLAIIFSLIFVFQTSLQVVSATSDPLSVANNRFGIHIVNLEDFPDAANLVNSAGGDWGYVTMVIPKQDKNITVWQNFFDLARRRHVIPIVRIATRFDGVNWEKPSTDEVDGWVTFLNSLNWVVQNRYVVIGNEPNHAKEWGGKVDPAEYALYLKTFAEKLKAANSDFYVLPAGLDASAPNSKETMDEAQFLQKMHQAYPELFNLIDGWASHSYPNPAFAGSENGVGRGSIRTFDWELSYLKSLGVKKTLPVFITETGWVHQVENNKASLKFAEEKALPAKFEAAFANAWNDKRIVAVTPFVLNYQEPPFDVFSWKNNGVFNSVYQKMSELKKVSGTPQQVDHAEILGIFVPTIRLSGANFSGVMLVKNKGQAIWKPDELSISEPEGDVFELEKTSYSSLEPGMTGLLFFKGKVPEKTDLYEKSIVLKREEKTISSSGKFKIITISPARMKLEAIFGKIKAFFAGLR